MSPIINRVTSQSRPHYRWQLSQHRTLTLGERALVMGIVNVTPDSFSDGGEFLAPQKAIDHALQLLEEGADLLDLGAESTRPGAHLTLTPQEEQQRLAPVIEGILQHRPEAILSVDTFHATTARFAVQHGVAIVNDVSGFAWDGAMPSTCAALPSGLVLMHTRRTPSEWATQESLPLDAVVSTVRQGLEEIVQQARAHQIATERIVLDPGFGFGKRGTENHVLLDHLSELHALGFPLLIGLSRKGFLAPHLPPKERLPQTLEANRKAALQGAHVLRVHDVRETRQMVDSLSQAQ